MKRRPLSLAIGVAGLAVIAAVLVAILPGTLSERAAVAKYNAIRLGMKQKDVRGLMRDTGAMYTDIGGAELMHVDGRFMIAVVYEPPPGWPPAVATAIRRPGDDWVAKEKILLDITRGGQVDNALIGLGIRSPRIADRDLKP